MSLQSFGWDSFFADQLTEDEAHSTTPVRIVAMHRGGVAVTDGFEESRFMLGREGFEKSPEERPTIGDWLLLDAARMPRIVRRLQRKSLFKRLAPGPRAKTQLIAANIDTLFIVTSCNAELNERRLERYLVLARQAGVEPVVVLTKRDLVEESTSFEDRARNAARDASVECVNAKDKATLTGLAPWLKPGQTVALVGSSGVGKSTLVNTLSQRAVQVTQGIREEDSRGRHTTTHRSLHLLDSGGLLLDVPGMRELGIDDGVEGVQKLFEDVEALEQGCRFSDCSHQTEPGCAILDAIARGDLSRERFESFTKLSEEAQRSKAAVEALAARQRQKGRKKPRKQGRRKRDYEHES